MNINEFKIVAGILIPKVTRKNKQQLELLLQLCLHSQEHTKTLLATLLPSPLDCNEVNITEYEQFIFSLSWAIYAHNSQADALDVEALELVNHYLSAIHSNFKQERKSNEELRTKVVKTNLTIREHATLSTSMRSFHYSSISGYLRDVIIKQLDIRPKQNPAIRDYFKQTKILANSLDDITDDVRTLNDKKLAQSLVNVITELKSNLLTTRNLATDAHNAQTAEILARKYLSAKTLKTLYRDKLENEDK